MHNLGHTRSSHQRNHILQTPDTFVRTTLPGMKNASAIVHVGPALGAAFTEYTTEFEAKGELGDTPAQRFIYVMDGAVTVEVKGKRHELGDRGYAYLPEGFSHRVVAREKSRVAVIENFYERGEKTESPRLLVSSEDSISSHALDGDSDLQVKCLLPDEPQFDFAVNTMVYQPGAALSMVEMHVMEHGLIMLEGGGIYRLGDSWYPVRAGDFIWMGPWCPQWFGAIGKLPAKYLIYKNWNRHPLGEPKK
ncbi:MAG: (S)-ureidoglycine aminohydrolase [Acidobacteria bacterium]|nr:MAG: (S)-ureidoglycine aminohydrolase [Acidobacteriota bacterium]PYT53734.1 MAG: (S)-ureidoglycine aminohydrolase [Acidobacteriota bacterium]